MASQASVNQVQSMYIAYYGRPGDSAGVNWWADQLDNNQGDLSAIIDQFGNSEEYDSRYGNLSDSQLINQFYQNTFGRDADEGGLNFYLGQLENGTFTKASIAKNIWDGVTGSDAEITADKLEVAQYFTEQSDLDLRHYGSSHIEDVVSMLSGITGSDASEAAARSQADSLLADMAPELVAQLSHEPSQFEQYMIELINVLRLNPASAGNQFGVEVSGVSSDPVQPLAINDDLMDAAINNSRSEVGPYLPPFPLSPNPSIGELIAYEGYDFTEDSSVLVNEITVTSTNPSITKGVIDFIYQQWFTGEGDLSQAWEALFNSSAQDIGVGAAIGFSPTSIPGSTVRFTAPVATTAIQGDPVTDGNSFLLGVVYDDNNGSRSYTPGEGVDDAIVRVTSDTNDDYFAAYTMDAGGYQIDLQPGTYDIMFSYNGQSHTVNDVVIGSENVKVDWMM